MYVTYSSGLPPTNDDNDSNHSGSNRSHNDGSSPHILPPVQLVGKGKQLPKVRYSVWLNDPLHVAFVCTTYKVVSPGVNLTLRPVC